MEVGQVNPLTPFSVPAITTQREEEEEGGGGTLSKMYILHENNVC